MSIPTDYFDLVNDIVFYYENEIDKNKQLLNETSYFLKAGDLKIATGINVAMDFEPCLQLIQMDQTISLLDLDWYDLLDNIKILLENNSQEKLNFDIYNLIKSTEDQGYLKLEKKEKAIIFCKEAIDELLSLQILINYRLKFLKNLDFKFFYNNALPIIAQFEDIVQELDKLSALFSSNNYLILLELLQIYPNIIKLDLDKVNFLDI